MLPIDAMNMSTLIGRHQLPFQGFVPLAQLPPHSLALLLPRTVGAQAPLRAGLGGGGKRGY